MNLGRNLVKVDEIPLIRRLANQVHDPRRQDFRPPDRDSSVTREDFVARWRARRDELARLGAQVEGAKLCDEVLADFEAVMTFEDEALLSLLEAAAYSGYSADHLRRMHRLGKLPARRDGRRLFFRRGDLRRKPNIVDFQPIRAYDPVADARRVATRTSHGGSNG